MRKITAGGLISPEIYKKTKTVLCKSRKSFRCVGRFVPPNRKERVCFQCRNYRESDIMFHVRHYTNDLKYEIKIKRKGWQKVLKNNKNKPKIMDTQEEVKVPVENQSDWEVIRKSDKQTFDVTNIVIDGDNNFTEVTFEQEEGSKTVRFDNPERSGRLTDPNNEFAVRLKYSKLSVDTKFKVTDDGEEIEVDTLSQEVGTDTDLEKTN